MAGVAQEGETTLNPGVELLVVAQFPLESCLELGDHAGQSRVPAAEGFAHFVQAAHFVLDVGREVVGAAAQS